MKKLILTVSLSLGLSSFATAETIDIFNKEVPLTYKEKLAVSKAKEWIEGKNYPFRTGDTITYLYGQGQPAAVCAPLQLCIVEFSSNEKVSANGIHLGDSARWQVSPSVGADNKTFLVIKPVDVGLSTSLVVVTDQGSYNIKLISRKTDLTPRITFHNPNTVANEWVSYFDKKEADHKKKQEEVELQRKEQLAERARQLAEAERKRKERLAEAERKRKQQLADAELKRKEQKLANEQRRAEYENAQKLKELAERKAKIALAATQLEIQLAEQRLQAELEKQSAKPATAINVNSPRNESAKRYQREADSQHELSSLDFNYTISDCPKCSWKPVRVYNNGKQTIIQMGQGMSSTEAPALLVLGSSGREQLVNYRVKGSNYIVDQVFNVAVLVAGVGDKQDRVLVTRGNQL